MSFLTGNALGTCACRQIPEAQIVMACVPFPVGFVKNLAANFLNELADTRIYEVPSNRSVFPHTSSINPWESAFAVDLCYTTATVYEKNREGNSGYRRYQVDKIDGVRSYEYGGTVRWWGTFFAPGYPTITAFDAVPSGSGWIWIDETTLKQTWEDGSETTVVFSDPYTYSEALASAQALLNAVDLINPARIYTAPAAGTYRNRWWPLSVATGTFTLKYPSEESSSLATDYFWANVVQIEQNLHRDGDGMPGTLTVDLKKYSPIGQRYDGSGSTRWMPEMPDPDAWTKLPLARVYNGMVRGDINNACNLWVSKMAFRTGKTGLNRREDYLLQMNKMDDYYEIAPVTYTGEIPLLLLPGEHIFLNTEIGNGYSFWTHVEIPTEISGGAGDSSAGAGGNENSATL
jgi:hypothetical protein